ncbi:MAG TPA: alr0857 family protein [Crinalium sp.]|jgi:hypothetical protein
MLKFTYTETGLSLEYLTQPWEEWIALRVILSVRAGQPLLVERGSASLLFPMEWVDRRSLEASLQQEPSETVHISVCDADSFEVSLQGTWITSQPDEPEGVFIATLSPDNEGLLFDLWQDIQNRRSFLPNTRSTRRL